MSALWRREIVPTMVIMASETTQPLPRSGELLMGALERVISELKVLVTVTALAPITGHPHPLVLGVTGHASPWVRFSPRVCEAWLIEEVWSVNVT